MTGLSSLVDPSLASDSGGVAGRIGYDFQAHVAAGFVLDMLSDATLQQVECETGDDVTLRWEREGRQEIEYVQVKTSDGDSRWGIQELASRTNAVAGSSLMEKSLACDAFPGNPLFRFVSTRDVRGELVLFKVRREKRTSPDARFDKLVDSFANRHKTYRSPKGRTTRDWAATLLWDVEGTEAALRSKNVLKLLRLAEDAGERPSSQLAEEAYDNLLKRVVAASKASRVTDPAAKSLSRRDAWTWWRSWLERMSAAGQRSLKVYNSTPDEFFVKIMDVDQAHLKRSCQAFDAEFDGGQWRRDDLARYLADWLPEITLPPKVLASFTHHEARGLIKRALEAFTLNGSIALDRLLAELMLNAILRHYRNSEPIACKLFTKSAGVIHASSAHIVHTAGTDEIWLGQARLVAAATHASVVAEVVRQVEEAFDRDILKREREVIVHLRDPNHLRATNIERALSNNAKLDDFLSVLRIPILIAYDSAVIAAGDQTGYVDELKKEVTSSYEAIKAQLSQNLKNAQVHVFLVPVECAASLAKSFEGVLHGK
jgi:hypothetical protein